MTLHKDSYLDFYVTDVRDPYSFSCQLVKNIEAILELMDAIATDYDNLSECECPLLSSDTGFPCCARFMEDECWYRAVIMNSSSVASGFLDVKFVDYGNSQKTAVSEVRGLKDKFLDFPAQALESALHGIRPGSNDPEWSDDAKALFSKLTKDKHIVALICDQDEEGKCQVKLVDTTGEMDMQVDQILIAAKYAEKKADHLASVPKPLKSRDEPPSLGQTPSLRNNLLPENKTPVPFPYSKEEIVPGKEEEVLISVTTSPSSFYVMLYRSSANLEKLMSDIKRHYARLGPDDEWIASPSVGDPCCAKFPEDNCWYRAIITDLLSSGQVEVLFIDYGNTEKIASKSIKRLAPKFSELPCQGIECLLNRICPNGKEWSNTDIRKFEDLALNISGKLTVVAQESNGLRRVEMMISSRGKETNLAEAMLLAGNARLVHGATTSSENLASVVSKKFTKIGVTLGPYEDVFVSHVEDPANFWCQLCKHKEELDAIMNALEEYCSSTSNVISAPTLGLACCAQFNDDQGWYRATITGIQRNKQIEVQFIDFGNYDIVPPTNLRAMKPEFMNLPGQAFKCRLEQIDTKNSIPFPPAVIDQFFDLTLEKELVGMITAHDRELDQYLVLLNQTVDGNTVDIFDVIAPLMPQKSTKEITVSTQELPIGRKEHVCITTVNGMSNFYCQLMSSASKLDAMMVAMDTHYQTLKPEQEQLSQPKAGTYCVAEYSADSSWYRAKIIDVNQGNFNLLYVDFGNGEILPSTKIKKLSSKFAELPEQVISCTLSADTTQFLDSQFVELTLDKEFDMVVVSVNTDNIAEVDLFDRKGKWPLTKLLTTVQPESNLVINQASLSVGETVSLYVTSASSPSKFYCQVSKIADLLADIMDRIHDYYSSLSDNQDVISSPRVGLYCVAKFGEDDGWYRGLVTAVDGNSVEVFYVDYGNSEVLPLSRIKKLKPEFASLPAQAVKCKLSIVNFGGAEAFSAKFLQLVEDPEVLYDAKVISVTADGLFEVELSKKETGESINELFVEEEVVHVPQGKAYKPFDTAFPDNFIDISTSMCYDPHDFYCQVLSKESIVSLAQLMAQLQDTYCNMSEADNVLNKPEVGSPCCTAYAGDNLWYRGIVTKVLDGITVKVRFVDYGNEETVPMNQIKKLLPEFLDLPIQSICCCLPAIGPIHGTQWSSEASNRFSELVDQKQLVAKLISKGVAGKINFELYDTSDDSRDVNIAEFLVNENLAVWVSSPAEDKQAQPLCKTLSSLGKRPLLSGQVVFIAAVDSPEKIYLQFCGTEERLENVMTKLCEFYESPQAEKCVAKNISPGELCVALFSEDEAWYRATVESISSDNVTVRFIDYGNTETMNVNNIRELSQEFLAEDVLAVECKLSDVRPLEGGQNWSSEATDFLSSLGGEDGLVVEVVIAGEVPEIRLNDKDGDVSERLVNKGLAESKRQKSKLDQKTVPVSSSQASQVSYHLPDVDIGSTMGVYVTDITSFSKFYCQIADCGDELNEMMDSIYNHYSKLDKTEGTLVSPVTGQPCVAIFENDGSWYRAVVRSVSSNDLEIQFVDYGNSQKVKTSKAKLMEPRFAKPPIFAIECSLDSTQTDRTSDDVNKFKAVVGEEKLTAKVMRKENNKYIVRLFQGDECISDSMLNKTAQCKLEIPNLAIQPGLDENVYVVYALSSTEVCLQLSQHSDSLDEVMTTIDYACRSDTTPVKAESLTQDAPCCALFEEGWYRAVVTSTPSSGHVEVEYIDYGNKATVPVSGLRSMPESCLSLPKQAIHCSLDSPGMSGVTKDMLEATLMDKQLQAKFIKHDGHCWSVELKEDGVDVTDVLVISSELDTTKVFNEPDIVANSSAQVYVSHTVNLLEFYLQKSSSTEELSVMGSRLNALYSVLQPTQDVLQNLDIGVICCAQFSEDQSWYRSVITSVIDEMHVQVQFVDYGNSDIVEKSKLKVLMDEFMDVPVLAVQSSLENPGGTWTGEDIEKFEALAYDQELSAEFLVSTGKTWQVRLTKDGTSLVQLMKDNGEAVVVSQENHFITDPILSAGQVLECAVSYVGEQGDFYVQLLDVTLLDKVVHMISEVYPSLGPSDECLGECKVGSFCCVKFSEDQEWYRGIVTELLPDSQAKVLFIDYGNSDVVAIPSIKKLRPELFNIPKLAIPCRLADAKTNWTEGDGEVLETKMLDKDLQVTLVQAAQNGWNVVVEVEGIILNNLSCFTGLVKEQSKSFSVTCLALNKKQPLKFLMAESLDCIWLQPMITETELTTLMNNIAESKPTESLSEVSLGLPCLCKFTEDDEWYRAEVTDSQGENVSVEYVDYGNTESVGISRISPIQEAFLHLPAQAVKCKMFDTPESNTGFIVDKLNEEYVELSLEVEVFQQDDAGVYMVKFFDEDGTELVPKLIDAIVTTKEPVAAVMNNCEESEINGVKVVAEKVLAEGKVVDLGSLEVKEAHTISNDCTELEEEYYTAQENGNGTSSDSLAEPIKKPLDGSAEAVSGGGIALVSDSEGYVTSQS